MLQSFLPQAPATLEETGLTSELVTDLVLKSLHTGGDATGTELSKRLGLVFGVIEPILEHLKVQQSVRGDWRRDDWRRLLSLPPERGRPRARAQEPGANLLRRHRARARCGSTAATWSSSAQAVPRGATVEQVRDAFSHLVVDEEVLDELGPAINAGHSIFIYGPPGNGKTVMAAGRPQAARRRDRDSARARSRGQIIRFFDPVSPRAGVGRRIATNGQASDSISGGSCAGARWCRSAASSRSNRSGSGYNPRSGVYRAPIQALANGGVLVIDDFGRQRCSPRDLLNWWMVPLESRVEYLTLQSGEKIEMPFLALVIFSTNLNPAESGRRGVSAPDPIQNLRAEPDARGVHSHLRDGVARVSAFRSSGRSSRS